MENGSKIMILIWLIFSACQSEKPDKVKVHILSEGYIYNEAPFPQCHASTIVEINNGLLASWFGGTHEKNPDVCIYTSELKNGQWTAPVQVADGIVNDTLRFPCWNPVLFKNEDGEIVLYYKIGPNPREWWGVYKTSADNGKSWSEAIRIPDDLLGPIKNKPVILRDGTILYPTSIECPEGWSIYVEKSKQDLSVWRKINIDNDRFNAIQPTILLHGDGQIQMLCRSKEKKIVETWSENQGETWTPLRATSLLNNNSGIDAVTLKNGMSLLVCNPVKRGRNKLVVKVSEDGWNWSDLIILEDQPEGEFSYPAIIQGEDGTVHITYTYNRKTIKYVHLNLSEN